MPTEIANRCPAAKPDAAALRRLVGGVLRAEGAPARPVTLVLADDALLRGLNSRFRGIHRATDVLSFDPPPGPGDEAPAELYVSMDRVEVQARRYRVSPQQELARLLIHGTLHLLGHDHHRAGERARMRSRERALLRELYDPARPLFTRRKN
ncbi:MAG: rRNA maturation RNase YbeY [Candidatus Eisenbacteria bacterium]|nr:rRNA maturation RNase YbeY [Candidatus Eisenbacteria bacterium]